MKRRSCFKSGVFHRLASYFKGSALATVNDFTFAFTDQTRDSHFWYFRFSSLVKKNLNLERRQKMTSKLRNILPLNMASTWSEVALRGKNGSGINFHCAISPRRQGKCSLNFLIGPLLSFEFFCSIGKVQDAHPTTPGRDCLVSTSFKVFVQLLIHECFVVDYVMHLHEISTIHHFFNSFRRKYHHSWMH